MTCAYTNDTAEPVNFGYRDGEMCLALIYTDADKRYFGNDDTTMVPIEETGEDNVVRVHRDCKVL